MFPRKYKYGRTLSKALNTHQINGFMGRKIFYTISLSLRIKNWSIERHEFDKDGIKRFWSQGGHTWIAPENDFWLEFKASAVDIVMNEDVS